MLKKKKKYEELRLFHFVLFQIRFDFERELWTRLEFIRHTTHSSMVRWRQNRHFYSLGRFQRSGRWNRMVERSKTFRLFFFALISFCYKRRIWWYWKGEKPQPEIVSFIKKNYPPDWSYADFAQSFHAELYGWSISSFVRSSRFSVSLRSVWMGRSFCCIRRQVSEQIFCSFDVFSPIVDLDTSF